MGDQTDDPSSLPGGQEEILPARLRARATAQQLAETLRAVRFAPLPVAVLAAMNAAALTGAAERPVVASCFAVLLALSLAASLAARLFRPLDAGAEALAVARHLAAAAALVAGAAWGMLPLLLFPQADPEARLVLALSTGMAFAAAPLLGPMPIVGSWFLAPALAGSVCGAIGAGGFSALVLPLPLLCLGLLTTALCRRLQRVARARIVAALRADEREDMLDLVSLDSADDHGAWFWRTDAGGRLREVSERLGAVAGLPLARLEGKPFERLFAGRTPVPAAVPAVTALLATVAMRRPFHGEELVLCSAGPATFAAAEVPDEIGPHGATPPETTWWRLTGKPVFDAAGAFSGYRGIGWNVSALRQAATRIAHLATHDQLTGLNSRDSFAVLAAAECEAAGPERPRALLLCNLDDLQSINDRLGHAAGDAVLRTIASRLTAEAPRGAVLARLNGDEFALLYAPLEAASAEALARRLIAALRAPIAIEGTELAVGLSIGIAAAPRDATGADSLVRRAGLALTRAKDDGKGRLRVFAPEMEQVLAARRELEIDIRLALARGEFVLHYQPLLDLEEGRIVSYEALIRWTSPTRGAVSPGEFIPTAEAAGLVVPIGRFVLTQACRDAMGWREPARVAVNISPQHLRTPTFMADVALALRLSGLPPWRLEVEVTEGVFLDDAAEVLDNLHALRAKGITVALDDFGTGYSSLNYLVDFPVDKIKIDRSFVTGMTEHPESDAVVDAMLTLARRLGIRVTAEGVETAEQALALKLKRCDDIQGWLLSRAVPSEAVDALAESGPRALRARAPALFESRLAAAIAMRSALTG